MAGLVCTTQKWSQKWFYNVQLSSGHKKSAFEESYFIIMQGAGVPGSFFLHEIDFISGTRESMRWLHLMKIDEQWK